MNDYDVVPNLAAILSGAEIVRCAGLEPPSPQIPAWLN